MEENYKIKTTDYTIEDEIKAFRDLVNMDGYFSCIFGDDIEQIVSNIENKFRFLHMTKLRQKEVLFICDKILQAIQNSSDDAVRECLTNMVIHLLGKRDMIFRKRELRLKLSDSEVDWLVEELKNKG